MISHHLCSERVSVPTSMVSYYHQVYSHTVFSLTHSPMVSYYHQVITHPHQSLCSHSLPSTMSSHTLLPSLHFTSFSLQMHHQCITNHLPHSPTHHASIASSSPHHLFLSPITTNRFLSLHTIHSTPFYHYQPSQSPPKSSPTPNNTHSSPRRTP